MSGPTLPPDQEAREHIHRDLDVTYLVEAAAGTGKTTSLVGRMTSLVASGTCGIDTLAAVTFTRKAAAELRERFSAALEERAREAGDEEGERLVAAAARAERCFIGTIHAFCARLLRERPVEAGVAVSFVDLDEDADAVLRGEAWDEYVSRLFASESADPLLERLAKAGLGITDLKETFLRFCDFPDVGVWPAGEGGPVDPDGAREALEGYLRHIPTLFPFPLERGNDKLMDRYERIEWMARHQDLSHLSTLMEVLDLFDADIKVVQKCWAGGKGQAKAEKARWDAFREDVVTPSLTGWREMRYGVVLPVLERAVAVYDGLRQERGVLNYQDLLMKAAALLRDRPAVRAYFRRRFTHLLVDEFQDTDPVQAEVVLFLTADDRRERNWRNCRPVPGALFVVGDPKQSIYRFRRADIATYQMVKDIIVDAGGAVLSLEANFRTTPALIRWSNSVFDDVFPAEDDRYSPASHRLLPGREEARGELPAGLHVITVPEEFSTKETAARYDSDLIARYIRARIDGGTAAPGDFMVVARTKGRLHYYAEALQRFGVPHRVSGGSAWGRVSELGLLASFLRALVEPENPVALAAVLRGELFGIDDAELYAFRAAGGKFSYTSALPGNGLAGGTEQRFREAFRLLRNCSGFLRVMSPAAALERTAAELGLLLRALLSPGGDGRTGTICKAFAVLREAQRKLGSAAEVADFLEKMTSEEGEFDGLPARAAGDDLVRVMNLHKVKGLEARVVFLADPGGEGRHRPGLHIDRRADETRGYITVKKKFGPYHWKTLAQPPGWEALEAEEGRFDAAEKDRLLYVAATRAGGMLCVTRRAKKNSSNPWHFFQGRLDEAVEIDDPGPQKAPSSGEVSIGGEEAGEARNAIASRWERVTAPGYTMKGARDIAVSAAELHRRLGGAGEHGTEWGTVLHFLLETAMREPERDLGDLARSALEEQGLSVGLGAEALETVAAVRSAEIWKRACSAEKRLVEVPFEICLEAEDPLLRGREELPTLLRGVVDLAFREGAGWVIVDWKTDADAGARGDALAAHYRGQTKLYAALWQRLTGEPVVETGIFFVSSGEYVKIAGQGGWDERTMNGKTM